MESDSLLRENRSPATSAVLPALFRVSGRVTVVVNSFEFAL